MLQHVMTNVFQYKLASLCWYSAKYRVRRKRKFPAKTCDHLSGNFLHFSVYILVLLLVQNLISDLHFVASSYLSLCSSSSSRSNVISERPHFVSASSSSPREAISTHPVHYSLHQHYYNRRLYFSNPLLQSPSFFASASGPLSSREVSGSGPASISTEAASANCPTVCSCIWKSGKQTATCDRRNLISVPVGLASTTQVIDLSGNALNILAANVFLDRGLVNLQRIFLVDCQLADISAESFVKLSNLIELDLANNSLSSIPSKSFAEAAALRRLSLAGNRIREVRSAAFLPLARLNVLDLSSNAIIHLDTDAFRGLRSLQTLKLEGNQLQTLPAAESFVQFLPLKMASLGLHDNRWRCDCHLKPMREWIALNNVPLPVKPICSGPVRLQGQKWDSISAHEFSCAPQIHTGTTHFYKHIGNNVTITCPVTGYPQPVIFWLFESASGHGAELYESRISSIDAASSSTTLMATNRTKMLGSTLDPTVASGGGASGGGASGGGISGGGTSGGSTETPVTNPEEYHQVSHTTSGLEQLLPSMRYSVTQEMENNHQLISTLTVHSLQPIDSQRITCYARNIGGSVMKNFSLVVSTQEPFSSSRSMDFIVTEMFVIFISIAILLLILLVFVTVFIAKFRKRGGSSHVVHSINNEPTIMNHHHHYGNQQQQQQQHQLPLHNHTYSTNGYGLTTDGDSSYHLKSNGGIISLTELSEKGGILTLDSVVPAVQYTSATVPMPGSNPHHHHHHACADGNAHTVQNGTSVLMVNTIDMIQSAIDYQKAQQQALQPDPNSTDLSSQSTTATSMTLNSCAGNGNGVSNAHAQSNGVSPNGSSDTTASGSLYLNSGCHQLGSMQPDLLASTQPLNGYYVDLSHTAAATQSRVNICDYTAHAQQQQQQPQLPVQPDYYNQNNHNNQNPYPLLNTGQLMEASGELIYGTRIAPTRLPNTGLPTSVSCHGNLGGYLFAHAQQQPQTNQQLLQQQLQNQQRLTKVKFADQLGLDQPVGAQQDNPSQMDQHTKNVYTYATLRKPHLNRSTGSSSSGSSNGSSEPLKPLNHLYHRNVSSYPEGFSSLLMESSVDSGEQLPGNNNTNNQINGNYPGNNIITGNSVAGPIHANSNTKIPIKSINRSATVDSLDEVEEDEYYRNLKPETEMNGYGVEHPVS